MNALYTLSDAGLNYFIASPERSPERSFILFFLKKITCAAISLSDLIAASKMPEEDVSRQIDEMLDKGWIYRVEETTDSKLPVLNNLHEQIQLFASDEPLLLVDRNGLIVADNGCEGIHKDFLAANAARYILKKEQAKTSMSEPGSASRWGIRIKWGKKKALAQIIYISTKKFILISGEEAGFKKYTQMLLIALLARRYISE